MPCMVAILADAERVHEPRGQESLAACSCTCMTACSAMRHQGRIVDGKASRRPHVIRTNSMISYHVMPWHTYMCILSSVKIG